MNLNRSVVTILVCVLATFGAGCNATLKHGKLKPVEAPPGSKGALMLAAESKEMPRRIGWGTFTLFAIPVAPVKVKGDPNVELMKQIRSVVEHSGYTVQVAGGSAPGTRPWLLSCELLDIGFRNYTYFFPLVFNWGEMRAAIVIRNSEDQVVSYRTYKGVGRGAYSFNYTVNVALTRMLDYIAVDLVDTDFSKPIPEACPALKSSDVEEVLMVLKALRRMNAPNLVPEMLPLLQHEDSHVVRDACRTIAVLGRKENVSAIEPLLNHRRSDVRKDARDAIAKLREKS